MLTRRIAILTVLAVIIVGLGVTLWQGYQLLRDLSRAEASVSSLRSALQTGDVNARDRAIADLQTAASEARGRTDGALWGALTRMPFVGDDAEGLRVLARTLALVSSDGVAPMADSVDQLDRVNIGDRIDLDLVTSLQAPVSRASAVFTSAATQVNDVDASGFLGIFDQRYKEYADELNRAAVNLRSADRAIKVLPDMVGADGPRDYLLLFQNNAEIRATGGMPGSWARVHAEDGRLEMMEQGASTEFPMAEEPVVPLTPQEVEIYGNEIGMFFQDPGFAPDFPRAAEIWEAHWDRKFPEIGLDGVLALDPVGMSYFLDGTGPIRVGTSTLTSSNVVSQLLNKAYLDLEPKEQDAFFEESARAIFDAATDELASPVAFIEGFSRAAREGRFLVASFDDEDQQRLRGSRVLGELVGDDGETPHVDIGLNDATGSKMSYYLRYWAEVESTSCDGGRQQLEARMSVNQAIPPAEAARLPDSITGGGNYGTEPGSQIVPIRIYGPAGGTIGKITVDGKRTTPFEENVRVKDRQVVTVIALLSTRDDVVINWTMESGPGQTGAGQVNLTPSVIPGDKDSAFASSCSD